MATPTSAGGFEGDVYRLDHAAGMKIAIKKVTFSASYATGGEALTPANLGLSGVICAITTPSAGYVFEYDVSAQKLKAYRQRDPAAAGGADIPLPEVAAAVNLSAVSTYVIAFGA